MSTKIIVLECAKPEDEVRARKIFTEEFQVPYDMITPKGQDPTEAEMLEVSRLIAQFYLRTVSEGIFLTVITVETEHRKITSPLRSTMELEACHAVKLTIRRKPT